ncbi:MAG: PorT family protein [Prevotella sp.]|jgi:hypothetical protein|nr:PorT family protein [Prevotella sp.]
MKSIFKVTFIILLVCATANSYAQNRLVSFGLKGGVNLSNLGGDVENTKVKVGYNVGALVQAQLTLDVYLLSGVELTTKGAKDKILDNSVEAIYLQLPIHVGYRMALSDVTAVTFHAGPYMAYGIGGKTSGIDGEENKIDTFSDTMYKPFDFGLGLGVGVEFFHFGIEAGYDLGLLDISQTEGQKIRMMNVFLSLNYKF